MHHFFFEPSRRYNSRRATAARRLDVKTRRSLRQLDEHLLRDIGVID